MSPRSAVLLPLYIYPFPGAWEALHEAVSKHPNLYFIVILNPHNGPGASASPDANYAREIPRLNAAPNVRTVGYVRVNYCKRDLADVYEDLIKYAGWAKDYANTGLAVNGIFYDETPNRFSVNVVAYLDMISRNVRTMSGILGDRMVIHNPGTIPDAGFANPGPDITTVLEESYNEYQSEASTILQKKLSLLNYSRVRCSYMVHSVPKEEVARLVHQLRHRGGYLFVTDLCEDYYVKFGSSWHDFIDAMALAAA